VYGLASARKSGADTCSSLQIIGSPTFVSDPFDNSSTSAVLAIDYDKASFGGGGVGGGAQFYVSISFSSFEGEAAR